jgi:hypothetical protein
MNRPTKTAKKTTTKRAPKKDPVEAILEVLGPLVMATAPNLQEIMHLTIAEKRLDLEQKRMFGVPSDLNKVKIAHQVEYIRLARSAASAKTKNEAAALVAESEVMRAALIQLGWMESDEAEAAPKKTNGKTKTTTRDRA